MAFSFKISTGAPIPIYRQITDQVRLGIATGKLSVGDPLPSVRSLAEELVINPNTVARAYADLTREGFLESRPGLGVSIAARRKVFTKEEGSRRLDPLLDNLLSEAIALGYGMQDLREAFEVKLSKLTLTKGNA